MTKLLKISDKCITAPKYNGGQLYKTSKKAKKSVKQTICLDWFEVTLSVSKSVYSSLLIFSDTPPPSCSSGVFSFDYKGCGSQRYKNIVTVYLYGERFGTILTCPRAKNDSNMYYCQFKIENHKLYQSSWIGDFELFMDFLESNIVSYTRVDIAVDGYEFLDVYGFFQDGSLDRLGRVKYKTYHEKVDGVDRTITGLDWGAKSSDKYMTIYNKTRRIEGENKQYVERFWANNNLETGRGDVERMELKMKWKCIQRIPSFDYKKLDSSSYLASVFRTQMKGWFEFVYPTDSNKTRCERFVFIDYESMGGVLLDKDSTSPSNEVWSIKITIKTLFHQGHKGVLDLDVCLSSIKRLTAWYGLQDWYAIRSNLWKRKFLRDSLVRLSRTG